MNRLLEEYVAEVSRGLRFLLPHERALEADEIRSHLTDLAEAHRGRGANEDEAAREAIRQFGVARDVSRRLVMSRWRGATVWRETLISTVVIYGMTRTLETWVIGMLYQNHLLAVAVVRECLPLFWFLQMILTAHVSVRLAPRFAHHGAALWGFTLPVGYFYVLLSRTWPYTFQSSGLTASGITFTWTNAHGPAATLCSWGMLATLFGYGPYTYLLTRLLVSRRALREASSHPATQSHAVGSFR